uniref:Retrovirus-related Pol polyprotein from transposon TNT 1-94 n=1 Tax=Opuntia streptacantha TaxID=393608 RepID=A0A7C9DRL2_OPUST
MTNKQKQSDEMRAVLTKHGMWKVFSGPHTKPSTMTEDQWAEQKKKKCGLLTDYGREELKENALSAIQLCLASHVLREVFDKTTTVDLWTRLEELYMMKSLANKIRLKERLYLSLKKSAPQAQKKPEAHLVELRRGVGVAH